MVFKIQVLSQMLLSAYLLKSKIQVTKIFIVITDNMTLWSIRIMQQIP